MVIRQILFLVISIQLVSYNAVDKSNQPVPAMVVSQPNRLSYRVHQLPCWQLLMYQWFRCGLCKASKQAERPAETVQEPSGVAGRACGGCEAARRWVASRNASMGRSAVRAAAMVAGLSRSMDANTLVA